MTDLIRFFGIWKKNRTILISCDMKIKLLLLSPYFPYPAHDGGKVRVYNLIKQLSLTCDICLLSFIDSLSTREFIPEMEKYCVQVRTILRDENKRILLDTVPRSPSFYYTPEMIQAVESAIEVFKPDIVHIEFLNMTQYRFHTGGIPAVYTEHDMSSIDFHQSFHDRDMPENERFVEWTRLIKFQKMILKTFDGVIVLTDRDKELLEGFVSGVRSWCIPTGVDIDYFSFSLNSLAEPCKRLVYVGHYKHFPNYDAVLHFANDIFPRILAELPGVMFDIVGSGMPRTLNGLEHPNIRVIGEVNDVRSYIRDAALFVAPIRLGGGIKGKILEAMSLGTAVVASTEASEGIHCRDNRDILVASNDESFAKITVRALNNVGLRQSIATSARRLVESEYDWRTLGKRLNETYHSVLLQKHS